MVYHGKTQRKRAFEGDDYDRNPKREKNENPRNEPLLKVLVPSYVAGALIGKGGSNLKEMKNTYGGFMRISEGRKYYPGTEERVVVVTGLESELVNINNHIMDKCEDPGRDDTMKDVDIIPGRADKVKFVLPDTTALFLIGRGGVSIKKIQEESKAKLHVDMPEQAAVPGERVLTISGAFDQRMSACKMVIEKVAGDETNKSNTNLNYEPVEMREPVPMSSNYNSREIDLGALLGPSSSARGNRFGDDPRRSRFELSMREVHMDVVPRRDGFETRGDRFGDMHLPDGPSRASDPSFMERSSFDQRRVSDNRAPSELQRRVRDGRVTLKIAVPEKMVGHFLGQKGSIIKEMVRRSGGAKLNFESKSVDGDRTLMILGNMEQVQNAYRVVSERVVEIEEKYL